MAISFYKVIALHRPSQFECKCLFMMYNLNSTKNCSVVIGSSITPVPILRRATCSTAVSSNKKHVVIMEPNKSELLNSRRQLFRHSLPPRLETVRIRAPILPEDMNFATDANTFAGDVSDQWNKICKVYKIVS